VLHGFTGNPQSMRGLAVALADAGLTVEMPLLPGHGTAVEDMVPTRWEHWSGAAEAAYAAARAHGAATAERRKWDSLRQKLSRSVEILAAIGEGYTQEQTAQRLQLTRNQVKYVIETLQDAYARFAAQSGRPSYPRTTEGVSCHGK